MVLTAYPVKALKVIGPANENSNAELNQLYNSDVVQRQLLIPTFISSFYFISNFLPRDAL